MPDVHPGKGCAIGTTMTLTDTVAPGLVGTDIGCGMTVCQVSGRRIELQKLDTLIRDTVPSGRSVRKKLHRFAEQAELDSLLCSRHIQKEKALASNRHAWGAVTTSSNWIRARMAAIGW